MAKQQDIKNGIVKLMSEIFIEDVPFAIEKIDGSIITVETLSEFRKIVSGGQITTTTNPDNQQLVLYQQDSQITGNTEFDTFIDNISRCFCPDAADLYEEDSTIGHICSQDYNAFDLNVDSFSVNSSGTEGNFSILSSP